MDDQLDPYDDIDQSVHTVMRKKKKANKKRAASNVVDQTAVPYDVTGQDNSGNNWEIMSSNSKVSNVKSETRYIVKVPSNAGSAQPKRKKPHARAATELAGGPARNSNLSGIGATQDDMLMDKHNDFNLAEQEEFLMNRKQLDSNDYEEETKH